MTDVASETFEIRDEFDLVKVRLAVRDRTVEQKFSIVEQTKMVTAASELARNALVHGGGGRATVSVVVTPTRRGVRVTFEDQGPGIADVELALTDGYTTNNGMGLGLGGARRLVNEFDLWSEPGRGTRVTITRWKQ